MTRSTCLAFVCLVGCAGDPFEERILSEDAGAPETVATPTAETALPLPLEGGGPDASSPPDAGLEAKSEAGLPEASPPEAALPELEAAACSPVAVDAADVCSGLTGHVTFPAAYVVSLRAYEAGGCNYVAALPETPAACRCAETYTCACLAAHGGLASDETCVDVRGAAGGSIPWVY